MRARTGAEPGLEPTFRMAGGHLTTVRLDVIANPNTLRFLLLLLLLTSVF